VTFAPLAGTRVIGIGYKAQHGKSTVAAAIARAVEGARIVELSDHVATAARIYHGMTTRDPATLVRVGQTYRALYGEDVWLRCCYGQLLDRRPPLAIVPNIRFPNEVDFVRALGGALIQVDRVHPDGRPFVADDRDPRAITETALDGFGGWDFVIRNCGNDRRALEDHALWTWRRIEAAR
jgi:hypothetical protein